MSKAATVHNPKKFPVPVDLTGKPEDQVVLPSRATQEFDIPDEAAEIRIKAAGLILNFK